MTEADERLAAIAGLEAKLDRAEALLADQLERDPEAYGASAIQRHLQREPGTWPTLTAVQSEMRIAELETLLARFEWIEGLCLICAGTRYTGHTDRCRIADALEGSSPGRTKSAN